MSYKVSTEIPVPTARHELSLTSQLRCLAVGSSLFVNDKTGYQVSGLISNAKRQTRHTYTTRTVIEDGVKGVRIWRVA